MERLVRRFNKFSTARNLILSFVAFIVIISVMGYLTQVVVYDVYGNADMPDTRFGYSYNEILEAFNMLGSEGLGLWSLVHLLDILFPLAYSSALLIGIVMLLREAVPENTNLHLLAIIPIIAAIVDYLENALIASQIFSYPILNPLIISIASIVTISKWILLGIAFGAILLLMLVLIGKKVMNQSK